MQYTQFLCCYAPEVFKCNEKFGSPTASPLLAPAEGLGIYISAWVISQIEPSLPAPPAGGVLCFQFVLSLFVRLYVSHNFGTP